VDSWVAYSNANKVLEWGEGQSVVLSRFSAPGVEFNPDELLVHDAIPLEVIMFSRQCLERVGGLDENLVLPEWDWSIRLAAVAPFQHVRRITNERRTRVGKHRDILSPTEMMEAVRQVYQKHPARGSEIERRRADRLERLSRQAADLDQINQLSQDETEKAFLSVLRTLNLKHNAVE
jgi:hypothetical protein